MWKCGALRLELYASVGGGFKHRKKDLGIPLYRCPVRTFRGAFRGAFREVLRGVSHRAFRAAAPPSPFRVILHAPTPLPPSSSCSSSCFSRPPVVPRSSSFTAETGVAFPVLGSFEGLSVCRQRENNRSRSVANRVFFSSAIKRSRHRSTHPRRRHALSAGASTSSCRRLSSVSSCSSTVVGDVSSRVSWSEAYAPTISAGV